MGKSVLSGEREVVGVSNGRDAEGILGVGGLLGYLSFNSTTCSNSGHWEAV